MPKKHGYRHQHRVPSCATAHFLAKYVISYIFMTAILKWCHKTRLRGGKIWNNKINLGNRNGQNDIHGVRLCEGRCIAQKVQDTKATQSDQNHHFYFGSLIWPCPYTKIAYIFLNFILSVPLLIRAAFNSGHVWNKNYRNNWIMGLPAHLLRCHRNLQSKNFHNSSLWISSIITDISIREIGLMMVKRLRRDISHWPRLTRCVLAVVKVGQKNHTASKRQVVKRYLRVVLDNRCDVRPVRALVRMHGNIPSLVWDSLLWMERWHGAGDRGGAG